MAFGFDQSYKHTTDEDALGSLTALAGVSIPPGAKVKSLDRELNQPQVRADHLYHVKFDDGECIHHFEALAHYRHDWARAQMDHAIAVERKYRLPLFSHLFLFHERGAPEKINPLVVQKSGDLLHQLHVGIIRLWQRPAKVVLDYDSVALYPWTALMDATPDEQREAARRILAAKRQGLELQMALLGALRYGGRETFLERLGPMLLTKDLLRESPMWREIEQEGEARGEARALRVLLTQRFGPIPEWAEAKISAADADTLERWVRQSAVAGSLGVALGE